jgi:hypothetical protein
MNATLIEPIYLIQKNNQRFFSYTIFPVNKINVEKFFKIMRKLLFNYSFYSHPEIGKFQGVTAVEHYDEGVSEDNRRVDIDGLEEARCAALVQSARYLEGIRHYHDCNVKERSFNVGDLVLRRIQNTDGLHTLSSPWEGPFTVAKVTGPGSYHLETVEGEDVNNSWNVDQLCRFYA